MKKKIYLLIPFLFFLSCFEEEPVPGFLKETTWVSYKTGSIYEGGKYKYSYMETHTLTFSQNTFTYTLIRRETVGNGMSYEDREGKEADGTYRVKYPNVYFTSDNYERSGHLSINAFGAGVLVVDSEEPGRTLSFNKR
ncbi:MAG: hypothetical protein LBP25_03665 [Tannerellaceae bacterium]|jgi:hypothetical protein|nr:hypothetical protein [Tannerellaceae bacterium]